MYLSSFVVKQKHRIRSNVLAAVAQSTRPAARSLLAQDSDLSDTCKRSLLLLLLFRLLVKLSKSLFEYM